MMNTISCAPFGSDYDCVMDGWEPKVNENGVIYFTSHRLKSTSWTHPYLDKILEELSECNEIRYAAYRAAIKLRSLQLKSGLSWITLRGIKKILTSQREPENNYRELMVSHKEAFKIIVSILEASDNLRLNRMHFPKAADIIVNLLTELYDTNYEGKFALSSLKISLTALCSAQLSEKYKFFYSEIYNYDQQTIERYRLLYLLYDLMQIVEVLKESTAFGTNVSVAVDSCLNYEIAPAEPLRSCEEVFYAWLQLEPQIIVWLPTLHRLAATENVCHNVQCSSCGLNPLKGFRYRCLQCFRYDLCQMCFFHGNVSLAHKLKHPMQEYCLPATRKDNTKAVFTILRNKLSKKHRSQSTITYLPLDDDSITGSVFQWQPRHCQTNNPKEIFGGSNDSGLICSENVAVGMEASCHEEDTRIIMNLPKHIDAQTETKDIDHLSKKDMMNQQCWMTKRIEELQDENRYLLERLEMLTQQKSSDIDSSNSSSAYIQASETSSMKQEDSTPEDGPKDVPGNEHSNPISISVIENELHNEKRVDDKGVHCEDISNDDNSLQKNLDIVGYYTPVRPVSSEDQQEFNEQAVDDIKVSKEGASDSVKDVESHLEHFSTPQLQIYADEVNEMKNMNIEVILPVANLELEKEDLTSESTVSGGLEYGYSDMSLHSENLSQKASLKGKEMLLPSDNKFMDKDAFDRTEKSNERKSKSKIPANQKESTEITQFGQATDSSQFVELNTNEIFFNISDILHEGSALPVLSDTCNKPFTPKNDQVPERRLTLEPVYRSTPMVGEGQIQSLKPTDKLGKENRVPGGNTEGSLRLVAFYKCRAQQGVTPKSSVLSRQNKKLLSSNEDLSTDGRSVTVDLSQQEVGMTTMFNRVERLGGLEVTSVGDSLAHSDKEEMDKILQKLDAASNSSREYNQMKPDSSSSSMLNAVLNVGDAMADLVQATADYQK